MDFFLDFVDAAAEWLEDFGYNFRKFMTRSMVRPPKGRNGRRKLVKTSNLLHLVFFVFLLIYSEIVLRAFNGTGIFQNLIYPILFALALGAFLTIPTTLFPRNVNRTITIVLGAIISALYTTECLVFNAYHTYMTIGSLLTGAGGVMDRYTSGLIRSIIGGIGAFLVFFLPLFIYIFIGKKKFPAYRYKLQVPAILLVFAVAFYAIGSLAASTGSTKLKYTTQFNFNMATQTFGLTTSLRLSATNSGSSSGFVIDTADADTDVADDTAPETKPDNTAADSTETGEQTASGGTAETVPTGYNVMELDFDSVISQTDDQEIIDATAYIQSLTPSNKNKYTGLFEGKNLILICAEAFSYACVNEKMFPTLYRLIHNGFYFTDYYQPNWGGSTSTGEYSFLLGLIPSYQVETMQNTIGRNTYFTLGNALQRENYYNAAFHNGDYTYYSREKTHQNLGYQTWFADGNGLEILNGVSYDSDEELVKDTLEIYMDNQPFSVYYMTGSGHCPYEERNVYTWNNLEYVEANLEGDYSDTVKYYYCYQLELEQCMATLVQMLEDNGIADDTVIVLTTDHEPYGLEKSETWGNDRDYTHELYGCSEDYIRTPWGLDYNNLIIWSGSLENEDKDMWCQIDDPVYSVDIVPTLLNLFGLEYDSRLLVGRDVFSDTDAIAIWNNGSWKTSQGQYNAKTSVFTPVDGVTVSDDYVDKISSMVTNKINLSYVIRVKDYYRYLFGDDTDIGQRITGLDQYIH